MRNHANIIINGKRLRFRASNLALRGTAVAQWLRCCATNRKVAGSIPACVTGIFHWHNASDRTMVLGSTQPLTEMSTRSISWGSRRPVRKADNLPPSCAVVMRSGNLNFLEPYGALQACNGTQKTKDNGDCPPRTDNSQSHDWNSNCASHITRCEWDLRASGIPRSDDL